MKLQELRQIIKEEISNINPCKELIKTLQQAVKIADQNIKIR